MPSQPVVVKRALASTVVSVADGWGSGVGSETATSLRTMNVRPFAPLPIAATEARSDHGSW
jgi:hypothetical protein